MNSAISKWNQIQIFEENHHVEKMEELLSLTIYKNQSTFSGRVWKEIEECVKTLIRSITARRWVPLQVHINEKLDDQLPLFSKNIKDLTTLLHDFTKNSNKGDRRQVFDLFLNFKVKSRLEKINTLLNTALTFNSLHFNCVNHKNLKDLQDDVNTFIRSYHEEMGNYQALPDVEKIRPSGILPEREKRLLADKIRWLMDLQPKEIQVIDLGKPMADSKESFEKISLVEQELIFLCQTARNDPSTKNTLQCAKDAIKLLSTSGFTPFLEKAKKLQQLVAELETTGDKAPSHPLS